MKIGVITHYDVHNHGALLQMYALQQVLRKFNIEPEGLTFKKNYDFYHEYSEKKYNIGISSIPYYIGYLIKNGFSKTLFNVKKRNKLENFKKEKNMVGRSTIDAVDLKGVFIGSDEVFSIETGLTPEFWGNNLTTNNIFSYAGCFGPTTIEFIKEKKAESFIKKGISNLKKISVRDENSKHIIESLSEKKALLVCDPVILYGYIEEKKKLKKINEEKYILVYSYDNNMNKLNEIENIKKFAKENNLKIYSVGFYHKWCDKNINVDPIELLEYVNSAELVMTDTFHGTIMSMILNKEFITKVHTNSNKLGFLLKEYNLTSRITKDFSDSSNIIKNNINYDEVNKIINERRNVSLNYIKECLGSINNEE